MAYFSICFRFKIGEKPILINKLGKNDKNCGEKSTLDDTPKIISEIINNQTQDSEKGVHSDKSIKSEDKQTTKTELNRLVKRHFLIFSLGVVRGIQMFRRLNK